MSLNPDDPTVRWAAFGRQMELWADSDIGKFFIARFDKQFAEGVEELKKVDPHDWEAVQRAQNKIRVAENMFEAMGEAIAAGHSALEELRHAES